MKKRYKVLDWEGVLRRIAASEPDAFVEAGILEDWDNTSGIIWHPRLGFCKPTGYFSCVSATDGPDRTPGIRFIRLDDRLIVSERSLFVYEDTPVADGVPPDWSETGNMILGLLIDLAEKARAPYWVEYRRRLHLSLVRF